MAVKRRMPAKPCIRCGKATSGRRSGRPTCRVCAIVLEELKDDNEMRRMGKLKGKRGRC
jgi:hypothetical protein